MKFLFTLLSIAHVAISFAQTNSFPKGTYMSLEEVYKRKPSLPYYNYIITKRTQWEIQNNGGNAYRIETKSDSISKKTIKKKVFAISDGDSLYVNCMPNKLQMWYSIARLDSNYISFRANADKLPNKVALAGAIAGPIAAVIVAANQPAKFPLYYLDLKTGKIDILTEYHIQFLTAHKALPLFRQFQAEQKKDEETLIKYFKMVKRL